MPVDQVAVEFLFRFEADIDSPAPINIRGGPQGSRSIINVSGGSFEGPKLRGEVVGGAGSEWASVRADGSIKADVRLVLRTHDGADILMTYNGIALADGKNMSIRTAPLFETGDQRYAYLNRIQAIAFGAGIPGDTPRVGYDVYRLL